MGKKSFSILSLERGTIIMVPDIITISGQEDFWPYFNFFSLNMENALRLVLVWFQVSAAKT